MGFVLGSGAAVAVVGLLPFGMVLAAPPKGDVGFVLPWPGGTALDDVLAQAGVRELGPVRGGLGALVALEGPQDVARLRAAGAMVVADGDLILKICGDG